MSLLPTGLSKIKPRPSTCYRETVSVLILSTSLQHLLFFAMLSFRALVSFVQTVLLWTATPPLLVETYHPHPSTPQFPNNSSFEIFCLFKWQLVICHKLGKHPELLKLPWFSHLLQAFLILFLVSRSFSFLYLHNIHPNAGLHHHSTGTEIRQPCHYPSFPSKLYPAARCHGDFYRAYSRSFYSSAQKKFPWHLFAYQFIAKLFCKLHSNLKTAHFLPSHFRCLKISRLLLMFTCEWVFSLLSLFSCITESIIFTMGHFPPRCVLITWTPWTCIYERSLVFS